MNMGRSRPWQNPTGNLQDLGAKSYWVFCKVRSLKSLLSFGGHRGWLLTEKRLVAKPHCCQIPNGPALLGPHPPRCWRLHKGFPGFSAPREGFFCQVCETNSIAVRIVSEQADRCYLVLLKLSRKLHYYLVINFYRVLFSMEAIATLRF